MPHWFPWYHKVIPYFRGVFSISLFGTSKSASIVSMDTTKTKGMNCLIRGHPVTPCESEGFPGKLEPPRNMVVVGTHFTCLLIVSGLVVEIPTYLLKFI